MSRFPGCKVEHIANGYKPQEKPKLSDAAFLRQDEFRIELTDFHARFGAPAAVTAR